MISTKTNVIDAIEALTTALDRVYSKLSARGNRYFSSMQHDQNHQDAAAAARYKTILSDDVITVLRNGYCLAQALIVVQLGLLSSSRVSAAYITSVVFHTLVIALLEPDRLLLVTDLQSGDARADGNLSPLGALALSLVGQNPDATSLLHGAKVVAGRDLSVLRDTDSDSWRRLPSDHDGLIIFSGQNDGHFFAVQPRRHSSRQLAPPMNPGPSVASPSGDDDDAFWAGANELAAIAEGGQLSPALSPASRKRNSDLLSSTPPLPSPSKRLTVQRLCDVFVAAGGRCQNAGVATVCDICEDNFYICKEHELANTCQACLMLMFDDD
jgi:hypothetical protein